jgi:addiction module RelE/StbE family toxin
MFTVNYTTPAEEDLISILEYISSILKSPSAAENLLNEIEEQTKILEENPFIFPLAKDEYINKLGIRHIAVKNYFLFYTIEEDKEIVSIIRIMYARRDWINLLRED